MPSRRPFRAHRVGVALALAVALAGCGSGAPRPSGTLPVTASFYPLQYLLERIGGTHVEITTLTRPGAEPHDLELTPRDLARLADSHLVVYLSGFQPAVDDAITAVAGGPRALDVRAASGVTSDPHFWLDPSRYAAVARAVGAALVSADPSQAADYSASTERVVTDLEGLDAAYRQGLSDCRDRTLVTGHEAFGLLAARYGFTQVPLTGVSPEAEPSAARLRDVVEQIRATGTRTVYSETLAPALVAEAVATETGATVAVLDPVEGLTRESAGTDYLSVMEHNLTVLRTGQECR